MIRLRGWLSGDDRTWWLILGGGFAVSVLVHTDVLRERLVPTPAGPGDVLACLLLLPRCSGARCSAAATAGCTPPG